MYKKLGATLDKPFFYDDTSNLIVCLFDVPHLVKSARNNLYKHNCVFNSEICSWRFIESLLEVDTRPGTETGLRLVRKLTPLHVYLKPFSNMRVYLAAQVLSSGTEIGLQTYVAEGRLPETALPTAKYCKFFDSLFDCFNSDRKQHSKVR
jgi:hypothetical protein